MPRHVNRAAHIKLFSIKNGLNTHLLSEVSFRKEYLDCDVLIVDKFGILSELYKYAAAIFIGGSLANVGGHNIYEALFHKKCLIIGKYYSSILDTVDMAKKCGVVSVVEDYESILDNLDNHHSNFDELFREIDCNNEEIENVYKIVLNKLHK